MRRLPALLVAAALLVACDREARPASAPTAQRAVPVPTSAPMFAPASTPAAVPTGAGTLRSRIDLTTGAREDVPGDVVERAGVRVVPDGANWRVEDHGVVGVPIPAANARQAVIAPDGKTIARFETGATGGVRFVVLRVVASGLDSHVGFTTPCPCAARMSMQWSPRGRYLIFSDFGRGLPQLRSDIFDTVALTIRTGGDRLVTPLDDELAYLSNSDVRLGGVTLVRLPDLSMVREIAGALRMVEVDGNLVAADFEDGTSAVVSRSGDVLRRLPYPDAPLRFIGGEPVTLSTDARATTPRGCDGALVFAASLPGGVRCIPGARVPALDSGARRIAFVHNSAIVTQGLDGSGELVLDPGPFYFDPFDAPALLWDASGRYLETARNLGHPYQ